MRTQVHHPRLARRAWVAVASIPVAFVVAMVVGEGIFSMLGYESSDEHAPAGAVALAGGAGMLVFVVPCVAAWILGRRAVVAGDDEGRTPALIGAVAGAAFVGLNLVGVVGRIAGL